MSIIILQGVLFVALIATAGALLYYGFLHFTPVGIRIRQSQNRKRIERAAAQACPIHGSRGADQLVRLPSGEVMCPDCYKESFHG